MQAATRRQRSTTSPASQRRTRTSKPYLCVGVMEREKWSLRDGEESIRGGKIPPPLEPAPPLTPIGTPVTPKSAQGGGPRPIQTRAHGSPGRPTRPTAEENLPHPIIQSVPKLHKTIRHPGKPVYPRLYWTPPPLRRHRCIEDPHTRAGPKRMHQPMLPAAHQPGPKPPRPSRNPNPEAERPQIPKPPPDQPRNSAAARLATYVRRHRHPQQRRMPPPEKQHPRVTNTPSRPRPQPQRRTPQENPSPGNPQMPQAHIATPRQQQKPQPDRIGTPTHTRWWSWSKEPREIDLMCQQKLFQG